MVPTLTHAGRTAGPNVIRSPASVRLLIELAAEHGVPPRTCLRGTDLAPSDMGRTDAEVEAEQELAVIRNLIGALPDVPGLGLQAGIRYHLTTHGIWGFALACSPNLGSAVRFGLRYLELTFAFTRIGLEERGREAVMTLDDGAVPADLRQFLVEREAASIMTLQRDLFSATIPLTRAEASYPEPPYADLYVEVFGVRPRFDAEANLAVFDAALLDLPLPQSNALTARACEEECRGLLERTTRRTGIAHQVRERLFPGSGGIPSMTEVAHALQLSPRTLRRRLASDGTSFRSLVNEVKMAVAEEFLAHETMTVEEIAVRLGYAEAASFTRAFARQRDVSPGRFRRTRLQRM